jgi:hypothetical protein
MAPEIQQTNPFVRHHRTIQPIQEVTDQQREPARLQYLLLHGAHVADRYDDHHEQTDRNDNLQESPHLHLVVFIASSPGEESFTQCSRNRRPNNAAPEHVGALPQNVTL